MFDFEFYISILSLIVCLVSGFRSGAPGDACFSMIPRHTHPNSGMTVLPQRTLSPYTISVDRTTFTPDMPVEVTISGAPFKGFYLVAGEEGSKDNPTGQFYHDGDQTKTLSCAGRNDGITHTSDTWKTFITVLWYGPIFSSADMIQFIATVVTNMTTFWTDVTSTRITPDQEGGERSEGELLTGALIRGLMRPRFNAWRYPLNVVGLGMDGMNNMGSGMNNMGFGMGGMGSQDGSTGEGVHAGSGGEDSACDSQSSSSSFGGGRFGGGFNRGAWGNPFANMVGGGAFF